MDSHFSDVPAIAPIFSHVQCSHIVVTKERQTMSARFETTIQPWGNSLGLRITRPTSVLAHLDKGTPVTVEIVDGEMLVKPVLPKLKSPDFPFTESALVARLSPEKAHADILPAAGCNP
jgi:antitoxin MazE